MGRGIGTPGSFAAVRGVSIGVTARLSASLDGSRVRVKAPGVAVLADIAADKSRPRRLGLLHVPAPPGDMADCAIGVTPASGPEDMTITELRGMTGAPLSPKVVMTFS